MRARENRRSAARLIAEYRRRIDRSDLPEHVRPEVERQLRRLARLGEQRPEYRWIQAYLDWMLQLPWSLRRRAEDLFSSRPRVERISPAT
jgi:ATP-dependent Lon protease